MTESPNIEIVEYCDSLAAKIADMWNSWDELWPGGFTQGVPYTEERVRQGFAKSNEIAILIAMDTTSENAVGYCSLYPHWRDPDCAYVGLLGVSPQVLGKGVGKRLLMRALDIAIEKGYFRVDLNTWAGNLRAVPLYKKIGFFWHPAGEGVTMQNYIPGILQHPLCQPFFADYKDPHAWYEVHVRELKQAPDEYTHEKMAVFPYKFKNEHGYLNVHVDQFGRGITGISRRIGSEEIKFNAQVDDHLALCGVPKQFTIVCENGTKDKLELEINVDAPEYIVMEGQQSKTVTLGPGENLHWKINFRVDTNAPVYRKDAKSPNIVTLVKMNGEEMRFNTGLKILPLAEARGNLVVSRVAPGGTVSVPISIKNNSQIPLAGRMMIEYQNDAVSVETPEFDFELDPNGLAGALVNVTALDTITETSTELQMLLELRPRGQANFEIIKTRKFQVPIFCNIGGKAGVGHDEKGREIFITSQYYNIRIKREGGDIEISIPDKLKLGAYKISYIVGPPFGFSAFLTAEKKIRVEEQPDSTIIVMSIDHPARPLILEDRLILPNNSPMVLHEVWVTNTSESEHTFQLKVYGKRDWFEFESATTIIPLAAGLTKIPLGSPLGGYPLLPKEPDAYKEFWIATKTHHGYCGQFFDPSGLQEVRINGGNFSTLAYDETTLAPGEKRCISRIWTITDSGHWSTIQKQWQELVKHNIEIGDIEEPDIVPPVELMPIKCIVPNPQKVSATVQMRRRVAAPLFGAIQITPPKNWNIQIITPGIKQMETPDGIVLPDIVLQEDTVSIEIELIPLEGVDGFGIHSGTVKFISSLELEAPLDIAVLGAEKSTVEIRQDKDGGLEIHRVNNGLIEFAASSQFGGCLYLLKDKDGTELITSAFPTPGPKSFFANYFGGVQPILLDPSTSNDMVFAKTSLEQFTLKPVKGTWSGLQLEWASDTQSSLRGLTNTVQYLTMPQSPIIKLVWKFVNRGTSPLQMMKGYYIDSAIDHEIENLVTISRHDGDPIAVRLSPVPNLIITDAGFLWTYRESDHKGMAILQATKSGTIIAIQMTEFLMNLPSIFIRLLKPGEEHTLTLYLFVNPNDDTEIIKLLEILREADTNDQI